MVREQYCLCNEEQQRSCASHVTGRRKWQFSVSKSKQKQPHLSEHMVFFVLDEPAIILRDKALFTACDAFLMDVLQLQPNKISILRYTDACLSTV